MRPPSFEDVVCSFYESLYRFALALTGQPGDACDLTQETFCIWAQKGSQLRDRSKVKSWLFTTMHRQHLNARRWQSRFPHHEVTAVEEELPTISPAMVEAMDATAVLHAIGRLHETHRVPLMLFYLEEHSYAEIAEILDVPVGTVMSRLSRGKAQLRALLADRAGQGDGKITPFERAALERRKNA